MSVGFKAPMPLWSGQDGTWWASHFMGWEAGAGLVLLPLPIFLWYCRKLLRVHRAGEVALLSVGSTGGECRPHSNLSRGEVSYIFPFLPFPPEELHCLF